MILPWQCVVCKERFTSLFKGSIHARDKHAVKPGVAFIEYRMDGTPVSRSLDRADELLTERDYPEFGQPY